MSRPTSLCFTATGLDSAWKRLVGRAGIGLTVLINLSLVVVRLILSMKPNSVGLTAGTHISASAGGIPNPTATFNAIHTIVFDADCQKCLVESENWKTRNSWT